MQSFHEADTTARNRAMNYFASHQRLWLFGYGSLIYKVDFRVRRRFVAGSDDFGRVPMTIVELTLLPVVLSPWSKARARCARALRSKLPRTCLNTSTIAKKTAICGRW